MSIRKSILVTVSICALIGSVHAEPIVSTIYPELCVFGPDPRACGNKMNAMDKFVLAQGWADIGKCHHKIENESKEDTTDRVLKGRDACVVRGGYSVHHYTKGQEPAYEQVLANCDTEIQTWFTMCMIDALVGDE